MSPTNSIAGGHAGWRPFGQVSLATAVAGVRLYWEALRDGLAALRRYTELTSRGVSHQVAVREIFVEHFGGW